MDFFHQKRRFLHPQEDEERRESKYSAGASPHARVRMPRTNMQATAKQSRGSSGKK